MNNAKWLSREQGQGTGGGWWRGEALKKQDGSKYDNKYQPFPAMGGRLALLCHS